MSRPSATIDGHDATVSVHGGEPADYAPGVAPDGAFIDLAIDSDAAVILTRGQALELAAWIFGYFDHPAS